MTEFLNEISPVVISALVAIVTAAIGLLARSATSFIEKKKDEIAEKVGIDKFNHMLRVAESVYYMIEQSYKNNKDSDVNLSKRSMFDEMMLSKFPNITPEEITLLREAVIGKVKSELKKIDVFEEVKPKPEVVPFSPQQYQHYPYPNPRDYTPTITCSTQPQQESEYEDG